MFPGAYARFAEFKMQNEKEKELELAALRELSASLRDFAEATEIDFCTDCEDKKENGKQACFSCPMNRFAKEPTDAKSSVRK